MCWALGGKDIHHNSCVFVQLNHFPNSQPQALLGILENAIIFLSIWQHNQLIPRQSHYTLDCQMPNRNLYYLYLCLLSCIPANSIVTSLVPFTGAMTLLSSNKWSQDPMGKLIFCIRTCTTNGPDTDTLGIRNVLIHQAGDKHVKIFHSSQFHC